MSPSPDRDGTGRVAVVTGAASGLGQEFSVALATAGYRVACALASEPARRESR